MKIKSLFTLLAFCVLLPLLVVGLSGCGENSPEPSDQVPVASDSPEPVVETPVDVVDIPAVPEETASDVEPAVETPVEQAILTWARDAGGLNHCDRLSIYEDGRVEAVVCKATTIDPTILGTLDEEQLIQVREWVSTYVTFSRREMEMSRAVRSTFLQGTGDTAPELEVKVEVAAFAAEVFFALTGIE